ncbi:MAG TPA: hypothetical protein PKO36_13880 [Candidatus Hydrogenedentes bacterium]|nr:hypothetical protein [Candidatus Hydrogenedentota bacterium]HOV74604.1 hypothetical protein [Candidatus Hydrogenedentota bacterium]
MRGLLGAFLDTGLGTTALTRPEDVLANEIIVFGDYVRIDEQTWAPGISYQDARICRLTIQVEGQFFYIVARHCCPKEL